MRNFFLVYKKKLLKLGNYKGHTNEEQSSLKKMNRKGAKMAFKHLSKTMPAKFYLIT
jgi:hypothetical protein